ncbi:MAG: ABC-type transporter, integral rane subunit [Bryobacterales bacterium]|nr:ABC-type transporter, integral rane subunit [Bryobacterales bacterium]
MKQRATAIAIFWALLLTTMALRAPSFFEFGNLRDIAVTNASALIVATGMTLVIIAGEIDVSVGSQFAVASVIAGTLVKAGLPLPLTALITLFAGACFGALNGFLVTTLGVPSIVATLAAMAFWRELLRWITQGAWVQGLPASFQWMGLSQAHGELAILAASAALFGAFAWAMRHLHCGRAVYAVGSNRESARLAGLPVPLITFSVFTLMGALTAVAAVLDSVRFSQVQSSAGAGLELKAISAVVIGGTAITGGTGGLWGTLLGASVLAVIAPALTFLGINAFWEKAIQGGIILGAIVLERVSKRGGRRAR